MIVFFHTLRRYLILVIVIIFLFSGVGFYLNYFYFQNVYQGNSTFYVLWEDPDKSMNLYSTLLTSEMIANDIPDYLVSQKIIQAAGATLSVKHLGVGPDVIAAMIETLSAKVQTNTRIVTLTMRGGDPSLVAAFLNALVDALTTEFDQLYKSGVIHSMTNATANPIPVSPQKLRDTVLFGMGGVAAGVLIILFIMYFNRQMALELQRPVQAAVRVEKDPIMSKPHI